MKRTLTAAFAFALLLGSTSVRPARADETTAPEAKPVQWIDGWAAGREAARKSGKLMLVYVHRNVPT